MKQRYLPWDRIKASGVQWLGEIPEHWEIVQGHRLFGERKERMRPDDEQLTASQKYGVIPQAEFMRLENQKVMQVFLNSEILKHIEPNDFVISMRSFQGGLEFCGHRGCVSSAYVGIYATKHVAATFFKYLFKSRPYIQALQSTSNLVRDGQALRFQNFAQVRLPVIPPKEQLQIAKFLDYETATIDALIDRQLQLIALLQEKRRALIGNAVTKGINPQAAVQASGAVWLGDIPQHWTMVPTKRLFGLECHPAPKNNNMELLSVYAEIGVRPRRELEPKGNKASTTDGYWIVKKGDLVVNKLLAWLGAIGASDYDGVTSPAYDILRKLRPLNVKYYHYLFRLDLTGSEFKRWSRGIMDMRLRLYFEQLGQISMPYPPEEEQNEIVNYIEGLDETFACLAAKAELQIALLEERRESLISAAVTGKIDVRGWKRPSADSQLETEMEVA